ncbi:hypothetical protein V6N13_148907, partial [Hibiscus sabdariffa]
VETDNAIVLLIGAMLALDWDIVTRHIPRTTNGVADALVKLSQGMPIEEMLFTESSFESVTTMLKDLRDSS